MKRTPEILGKKFGKLVTVELNGHDAHGNLIYLCLCECGASCTARKSDLNSGKKKSCGCMQGKRSHGLSRKNGKKRKLYSVWVGMRDRCNNSNNKHYDSYGGRGIGICKEWEDYAVFHVWAHSSGYKEGLTIERIDNDGNYCPENCTWIPQFKQICNTRKSRFVTFRGITKTIGEWAREFNIDRGTLHEEIVRRNINIPEILAKRGIIWPEQLS